MPSQGYSLKTPTTPTNSSAWDFRPLAAAAICSNKAAFCCVVWSIDDTASLTCATPACYSPQAALI